MLPKGVTVQNEPGTVVVRVAVATVEPGEETPKGELAPGELK